MLMTIAMIDDLAERLTAEATRPDDTADAPVAEGEQDRLPLASPSAHLVQPGSGRLGTPLKPRTSATVIARSAAKCAFAAGFRWS
jgi:hypothetical protein